jgi:hypothetical protein
MIFLFSISMLVMKIVVSLVILILISSILVMDSVSMIRVWLTSHSPHLILRSTIFLWNKAMIISSS